MKKVESKCKFCHKPLVLEVDDAYDELADPHHLIPLSACNRCADFRQRRRELVEGIRSVCLDIARAPGRMQNRLKEEIKEPLALLLKKYLKLANTWHGADAAWDQALIEQTLLDPQKYLDVLERIWNTTRTGRQEALL
jgi:hypothetical protein